MVMLCIPETASDLFFNPGNVGEAAEPNFAGRSASFACGAILRISLQVNDQQRITGAKFRAIGCSVAVATASLLTQQIEGKTTSEAAVIGQRPDLLNDQLGPLAASRSECPALACAALVSAIANYSNSIRDSWQGDEALICTCFGVSERTIEEEVQKKSLSSIAEVTRACNAGAGCRSCYPLIEDILAEMKSER